MNTNHVISTTRLRGGPWNEIEVVDLGQDLFCVGILARRGGREVRSGQSIYEPSASRTEAFWLDNKWDPSKTKNKQ